MAQAATTGSGRARHAAFALVAAATLVGMAGIDLVLPAVPSLPATLGGTIARAQYVLAAFVAGTGLGLVVFGELGARVDPRRLLVVSLVGYGVTSALAVAVTSLDALVALRVAQGAFGAAAAVFAPGMIRALYDDAGAVRALGVLGSIEALAPAVAPIVGVWLFARLGWQGPFIVTAVAAFALAVVAVIARDALPRTPIVRAAGGYGRLLRDRAFLRDALAQAFTLGGLLVFVLGAPAVIVATMGGALRDFIVMQVTGIACFVVAANATGALGRRWGTERTIVAGTTLAAFAALAIVGFAIAGGHDPAWLPLLFAPMNLGLGLRGPPGFFRAIQAAGDDASRGAALVILFVLMTTAGGTALAATWIARGLLPLAIVSAAILAAALVVLLVLAPRADPRDDARPV